MRGNDLREKRAGFFRLIEAGFIVAEALQEERLRGLRRDLFQQPGGRCVIPAREMPERLLPDAEPLEHAARFGFRDGVRHPAILRDAVERPLFHPQQTFGASAVAETASEPEVRVIG